MTVIAIASALVFAVLLIRFPRATLMLTAISGAIVSLVTVASIIQHEAPADRSSAMKIGSYDARMQTDQDQSNK